MNRKKTKTKMHKTSDPTWHTMTYSGTGKDEFDIEMILHYNEMLGINQIIYLYKDKQDGKIMKYRVN